MIPDYTLVCGVDRSHLDQLRLVWPTWKKHKPDLGERPMVVFRDRLQVSDEEVHEAISNHPNLSVYPWPREGVVYAGIPGDKWKDPQRFKMLSGFVHIPAMFVRTPYWLKLDTDAVAQGQPDWIDPSWFDDRPAIISHAWSFTKPADQMVRLDEWVRRHSKVLPLRLTNANPLNLIPKPGRDRLGHKRIISWCAFFRTDFSRYCAYTANKTCGSLRIPVHSQDGYVWYMATRLGEKVIRVQMKRRGWEHWLTNSNISKAVTRSLWPDG